MCINKFGDDTEEELNFIKDYVAKLGYKVFTSTSYVNGGEGAIDLANEIVNICNNDVDFKLLYDLEDTIVNKINTVSKEIYRCDNVNISEEVLEKINTLEQNGFGNLPVCIAKTQYSFSDNPKLLGAPTGFDMTVTDVKLSSGAGFIVVLMGNIMTMPGLSKNSAYLNMKIDNDGNISGLF